LKSPKTTKGTRKSKYRLYSKHSLTLSFFEVISFFIKKDEGKEKKKLLLGGGVQKYKYIKIKALDIKEVQKTTKRSAKLNTIFFGRKGTQRRVEKKEKGVG
jgi:hypothetical protein